MATNRHALKALNYLATFHAEPARRAGDETQTPCQTGRREAVFDPWNGKERAETARKLRFLRFGQSFQIF